MTQPPDTTFRLRVSYHHFFLKDHDDPVMTPFPEESEPTGLAQAIGGCVIMFTGVAGGPVTVTGEALAAAPEVNLEGWDDVVEVGEDFVEDTAYLSSLEDIGPEDAASMLADAHGWYRVRVHCRGRDLAYDITVQEPVEEYLVQVWPAPPSESVRLKSTDRTGEIFRLSTQ